MWCRLGAELENSEMEWGESKRIVGRSKKNENFSDHPRYWPVSVTESGWFSVKVWSNCSADEPHTVKQESYFNTYLAFEISTCEPLF